MGRKLRLSVVVGAQLHEAGSEPPAEVAKAITNPDAWEGGEVPQVAAGEEPPRSGRGSGVDEWRVYAETLGVDVPEDAGRDDIVALVDAQNSGE
jgi:hypothetical protein